MATVIKNPAMIHCLNYFGLTPDEWRSIELKAETPPPTPNPFSGLVNYLADIVITPRPPVDSQG